MLMFSVFLYYILFSAPATLTQLTSQTHHQAKNMSEQREKSHIKHGEQIPAENGLKDHIDQEKHERRDLGEQIDRLRVFVRNKENKQKGLMTRRKLNKNRMAQVTQPPRPVPQMDEKQTKAKTSWMGTSFFGQNVPMREETEKFHKKHGKQKDFGQKRFEEKEESMIVTRTDLNRASLTALQNKMKTIENKSKKCSDQANLERRDLGGQISRLREMVKNQENQINDLKNKSKQNKNRIAEIAEIIIKLNFA